MTRDDFNKIKDSIKKLYNVEIVDGFTDFSFHFISNTIREPKIEISGSPTGLFNISVEATKNGTRQIVYSGSGLNTEDLLYMLKVEIDYFKKLKR